MNFDLTQMSRFQGTPHNVFNFLHTGLDAIRGTMTYAAYVWEANPDPQHIYLAAAANAISPARDLLEAEQRKLKELIASGPSGWVSKVFEWRVAHLGHNLIPMQREIIETLTDDSHGDEHQRTRYVRLHFGARRVPISEVLSALCNEQRWEYPAKQRETHVRNHVAAYSRMRGHGFFADQEFERCIVMVLTNLIENALKYCGSERPDVQVITSKDKIVVKDTGIGMYRAFVAKLNDPTDLEPRREDGTISDGAKNTGTGWPTIKRLMARHGRRYLVESWRGHGTKVTLFLEEGDIVEFDHDEPLADAFIPEDRILPAEQIIEAASVFRGAEPLVGWRWVQHKGKCMLDVSESPFFRYLPFVQDLARRIQLSPLKKQ